MKATGIILAGGKSSRMGTDKGLIDFNGKKMIQHLIDVLATGLFHSSTEKNIILSCDTPFITAELITYLYRHSSDNLITIVKENERTHPLIGIYSKACLPTIEQELELNHLRIRDLRKLIHTKELDVSDTFKDTHLFKNINTQEELENLKL